MVSDEMVELACKAVTERRGFVWPNEFSDDEKNIGRENMRAALEAALSSEAEPVVEIVEAASPIAREVLGCDIKALVDLRTLPVGTKLYAAPPAPAVAVKALQDAVKLTVQDAAFHLKKYRPHCLEALEAALSAQVQDVENSHV